MNFPFPGVKLGPYFGVDLRAFDITTIFWPFVFIEQAFQLFWRHFLPQALFCNVCQMLQDFVAGGVIILKAMSNVLEDFSLMQGREYPTLGRWSVADDWSVTVLHFRHR